jgi:hypothetical protein
MKINGQYGNSVTVSEKVAQMPSKGSVKNNIPVAETNKIYSDNKFEGGKMNGVAYVHNRKCYQ